MNPTMTIEFLKQTGITEVEARIYLCLLKEGSLKAGSLAKLLGIHRRSVYDAIDRLRKKGLISYIKTNNVNNYEAADPNRILAIIKEQEKNIQSIIPELQALKQFTKEKKETLFFRGQASIKAMFNDQIESLSKGEEICTIKADIDLTEFIKYFFPKFNLQRSNKGISMKMIVDKNAKEDNDLKTIPACKIKFTEFSSESKVSTHIYSNRVAIIKWSDTDEPIGIIIKEQEIADRYRDYFNLMWNSCS